MSAGVVPSARRILRTQYTKGAGRILDNREYPQWSAAQRPPSSMSSNAPVEPHALRHVMRLTARLLQFLSEAIEGARVRDTHELDVAAAHWAVAHDAYPAPLHYHGFPKAICASVNEIAVHGVPDTRPLRRGDVVNVDCSLFANAHYGDTARSVVFGGPLAASAADATLIDVARKGFSTDNPDRSPHNPHRFLFFFVLFSYSCWYCCCASWCEVACRRRRDRTCGCRAWLSCRRRAWWSWHWPVSNQAIVSSLSLSHVSQRISLASHHWPLAACC
jgi:hypothetical protein